MVPLQLRRAELYNIQRSKRIPMYLYNFFQGYFEIRIEQKVLTL